MFTSTNHQLNEPASQFILCLKQDFLASLNLRLPSLYASFVLIGCPIVRCFGLLELSGQGPIPDMAILKISTFTYITESFNFFPQGVKPPSMLDTTFIILQKYEEIDDIYCVISVQ